jgi:hypothetical protein
MYNNSFTIGNDLVTVKTTDSVALTESFTLVAENETYNLEVKIAADLGRIPKKYHEVFLNMITSKYLNKVSFSDNPFSESKKKENKKWWNFWRSKN